MFDEFGHCLTEDWHAAATEAGNAVLTVNPELLIIVGGLSYGKDLTGVFRLCLEWIGIKSTGCR